MTGVLLLAHVRVAVNHTLLTQLQS